MRIKRIIGELCILRHRASCSKNERQAAKHILDLMRSFGLKATIEIFKSQKSMTGELVSILSGFISAIVISFHLQWIGVVIGTISGILFWGYFSNRFKPLSFLFRRASSCNVIGRFPNESATHKIVITAHHDTARSSLLWHPKMVRNFRSSFLTGVALLILLELLILLKALEITSVLQNVVIIAIGIYVLGQIAILVHGRITGKLIQGANDNASGVAVMLDLAARLKDASFPDIEFWFVSTGSEEVGAVGMSSFFNTYRIELPKDKTYFINIDNVGQGQLHYYLGEGMLNFYRFSPTLLSAAKKATGRHELADVSLGKYRVAYTDAIIPASRGYHTILLLATDERNIIPNWHWETDVIDHIDFDLVQKTSDFIYEMIKYL